jgi:acyl carrier protein
MKSIRSVVLHVLAHHTGLPLSTIHPWQELERDLDMTPLEVVLVALEIEGAFDVDLDVEGLEHVRTVRELTAFFAQEISRARHARVELDVA